MADWTEQGIEKPKDGGVLGQSMMAQYIIFLRTQSWVKGMKIHGAEEATISLRMPDFNPDPFIPKYVANVGYKLLATLAIHYPPPGGLVLPEIVEIPVYFWIEVSMDEERRIASAFRVMWHIPAHPYTMNHALSDTTEFRPVLVKPQG